MEKSYQEFFKNELYNKFVKFLQKKFTCYRVIELLNDRPLFERNKVNEMFKDEFNEFLSKNDKIREIFLENDRKCYMLKNIHDQPLRFPVDVYDDALMCKLRLRKPLISNEKVSFERAKRKDKIDVEPFKNQVIKSNFSVQFRVPEKLIVHFKKAYADHIGKTTVVFNVNSKEEIATILFDRYENKIAFAQCKGHKFEFVKRKKRKV